MDHEINTAAALWQNLEALMLYRYGSVNLSKLAVDCGFSQSTATRIKQQGTAVGIDRLEMIARAFGLATWQLLVPGLDPKNPPALQPVTQRERELYDKIMSAAKAIVAEPGPPPYR
jgi:transcriptional regulator with XRE-family HTH domain